MNKLKNLWQALVGDSSYEARKEYERQTEKLHDSTARLNKAAESLAGRTRMIYMEDERGKKALDDLARMHK